MANVDEMVVKWSMDSKSFNNGLTNINKSMNVLKSEFKATSSNLKKFGTTTDQLKNKQQYLTRTIELQKEKVKTLKEQYEKQKQATGENSTATQNLAIKLNNAISYYNTLEGELKETSKELENQSSKLTQLSTKLDSASKKFSSFGKAMTSIGKKLTTAITVPIVGVATASAKVGMDFESAMSNVKAISGATGDELKSLEEKAREMGAQTSKSATDSANALGYMALAGWNTQQMLEGLEPILRASEAGSMDLATCSDLVTDSMSSLSLKVSDLGHYLDVVAKTQNSANTSMQGMLEAYNVVGGTFSSLNVSLEEGATWLGVLANRSLKGSEAGNSLNSLLINLTGGSSTAASAMQELGVSAWDTNGKFIGIEATLRTLESALASCTQEQRTNFESAIGGKTQITTLQKLLSGLKEEYGDLKDKVTDCDGTLINTAKTMQDNNKGSITALKSALEELGLKIYDVLKPTIADIIEKIQSFINWLNKLSPSAQETVVKISAIVAAIGPALIVLGTLSSSVAKVVNGFSKLINFASKLKGAFQLLKGINFTTMFNPWVLGAIAMIGIGVLVIKNWDWIKEKAGELKDWVSDKWNGIKESTSKVLDSMKDYAKEKLGNIKSAYEKNGGGIKGVVAGAMQGVKEYYSIGYDAINKLTNGKLEELKNAVKDKIKSTVEYISSVPERVSNFFTETKDKVIKKWEETKKSVIQKTQEIVDGVVDFFEKLPYRLGYAIGRAIGEVAQFGIKCKTWTVNELPKIIDNIVNWFAELPGRIGTWLLNTYTSINNWCLKTYNTVTTKIKETVDSVVNWFAELPSRIGNWLVNTYTSINNWCLNTYSIVTTKISETINSVVNWFAQLPSRIWTWLTNTVNNIGIWAIEVKAKASEVAQNLVNTVVNTVRNLPSKITEIGKNIVNGLWEGIQSKWNWLKNKVSDFCSGFTDGIKDAFEIHSPSRVMRDEVGKYLAQGIGVGFDDEMGKVNLDISKTLTGTVSATGITTKDLQGLKNSATSQPTVLYVTSNTYLDGKLIATETTKQVVNNISRQQNSRSIGKGRLGIV